MIWITESDLKSNLRAYRMNQITDAEPDVLDQAESEALATVKDALHAHFDVSAIFGSSGSARPQQVVSWMKHIILFKIYERVPDDQVPDRVVKLYDESMKMLDSIAAGERSIDLPRRNNADGIPKTKFRWGSVPKRTN